MKRLLGLMLLCIQLQGQVQAQTDLSANVQPILFSVTMVMVHDVANPPAASRFYTYCLLGAHEIVAQQVKGIVSPTRLARGFSCPAVAGGSAYNYQIAALYCMLETGRQILPSGYMLEEEQTKFVAQLKAANYSDATIQASIAVAQQVAKQVLAYAATDNYSKLSTRIRYRPNREEGYWYPTPPAYMEAIEPHWRTIRPVLIDSCSQFKPTPPVPFSKDEHSAFYALTKEVFTVGNTLTDNQRLIASFWDCNPFAVNTAGHMAIGFKKISPGGHWINITSIASRQANLGFNNAILVHSLVAMTLMDAFISCWDEKYRSSRIRPETVINKYMDVHWKPLLQTPPFPEYTSGHSVISTAAAEVLTYLLGDNVGFTDTSEMIFDLPERSFGSFRKAAAEAAISRLYGGIHFRDAIEAGQKQGEAIGTFIVQKLNVMGVKPFFTEKVSK